MSQLIEMQNNIFVDMATKRDFGGETAEVDGIRFTRFWGKGFQRAQNGSKTFFDHIEWVGDIESGKLPPVQLRAKVLKALPI